MIHVRLHGRLGNQMFQYAAGRALALRHETEIQLDTRGALDRNEGVLTRVFNLPVAHPTSLPPYRKKTPLRYVLWRKFGEHPKFQREQGLGYNRAFDCFGDDLYLHGYWQSEKYFIQWADTIRADFTFPTKMSEQNKEMAQRIRSGPSISLHVRRGDYLAAGAHGLCTESYYANALAQLLPDIPGNPTIYVFSDDPDWSRSNLSLPCEKVVVEFNGPDHDFEDMRLMSLCDHNVIANSSFSWWAAWLNTNPYKKVAGPAQWFNDPKLSNPDILPADWLRISI